MNASTCLADFISLRLMPLLALRCLLAFLRLLGEISDGLFLLLGLKTDRSCLSDVIVLICGLDTY